MRNSVTNATYQRNVGNDKQLRTGYETVTQGSVLIVSRGGKDNKLMIGMRTIYIYMALCHSVSEHVPLALKSVGKC